MNDHRLEAVRFESPQQLLRRRQKQILGIIKKSYQTGDAVTISTLYQAMVRLNLEYV